MKPTVGRIVHYVSRGSADGVFPPMHVPLIVVTVNGNDEVNGWTMTPAGQRYEQDVRHDESGTPSTWHWPEREAD